MSRIEEYDDGYDSKESFERAGADQPEHVEPEDDTPTATLWCVEHCANNLGVWSFSWHATEAEAIAWRVEFMAENDSQERDRDEMTGDYGDCDIPECVTVRLTPEGLLNFAENYAVDQL